MKQFGELIRDFENMCAKHVQCTACPLRESEGSCSARYIYDAMAREIESQTLNSETLKASETQVKLPKWVREEKYQAQKENWLAKRSMMQDRVDKLIAECSKRVTNEEEDA